MKKTILLVDDDPVQLKLAQLMLCDAGFTVRTASGGGEALESARRECPDAILSDVLMRDFDGFHLCTLLRKEPALARVPVVLVSAHFGGERDRRLADAVGANGLAERSPDFRHELAAIERALDAPRHATPSGETQTLYAERVSGQLSQLADKARAAELSWKTLFERANDGIVVLDGDGRIQAVNRCMEELVRLPRERLVGQPFAMVSPPELSAEQGQLFAKALTGPTSFATQVQRPSGERVHVQLSTSAIEVEGKRQVIAIARDITRDLEAARQLAASEEKYRNLVENLVDVAWVSRLADGKQLFMSQNIVALTGYTSAEVDAAGPGFFPSRTHPEDLAIVMEAQRELMQGRPMDMEHRWKHRDGTWRWCRVRARVAQRAGIDVVEGLISDITEHKKLADDYRQAQKMEAIGHLTGGVAHDFNNLLCVILANSELLMRTLPADDERREDVASIREAGERAAALTRQLLAFSRKQVLRPKLLDLSTVVVGVQKLLHRVIGEDLDLQISAAAEPTPVFADASQLEQVLLNLSVNARDAMPNGGRLTIDTAPVTLAEGACQGVPAGRYVRLTVSDTGCGMDEETQRRIFEPFFTTKPVGKGTGMGLSTCFGIVTQSGGHIAVRSAPGEGASFSVYLPAAEQAAEGTSDAPVAAARGGSETVLLVEDDDALRRTIGRALARLGYAVLAARDGSEAEALFRQHRDTVSLVLSDVVMPGKSGLDTVAQLRADQFNGKVLFMSGYADRPELLTAMAKDHAGFIQKPFERAALEKTVREMIDGGRS